ncbi:hypothetical protein Angca_010069, partial [Angiostrongylus cantonensis]
VLVLAYSSVGFTSLVGNLAVLTIVVCRKEMRTVTNIFISSVSTADLLITSVSLWATPLAYFQKVWNFGQVMCYIVYVIQGASLMWVPLTLAAIAVDRYRLVAQPFLQPMSTKCCFACIASIWLSAFAVLSPMLANVRFFEISPCYKYCLEFWPSDSRLLYGLFVLLVRSALPLALISWCHWRIASILNEHSRKFRRVSSGCITTSQAIDIKKKQRLQTLLLAMVVIFAVSSLPIDLFNVLQDMEIVYKVETVSKTVRQSIFFFSHWLAMAGTLLNPLVYAWWNTNFRRQIQDIINGNRRRNSLKRRPYSAVDSVCKNQQRFLI